MHEIFSIIQVGNDLQSEIRSQLKAFVKLPVHAFRAQILHIVQITLAQLPDTSL